MKPDRCLGDEIVELYFYDELDAPARGVAEAHLAVCSACRESLEDLRAITAALAASTVDAPPSGDWSGFMRRLDARLDREAARARVAVPPRIETAMQGWLKIAAAIALIASGMLAGWTLSRVARTAPEQARLGAPPAAEPSIADAGDFGLERARVVLAGLAQKEDGAEWSLERRMAANLLPEVRLIRQAAADRGRGGLEDILMDVETLLLQASYAETDDAETLARLRRMIDRRDVLMRLSMAAGEKKGL